METLKDKCVLLTGATGGIGSKLLPLLHYAGARVFITGRNQEKLAALAASLKLPAQQMFVADISQQEEVTALKNIFFSVFENIDIVINAAGIGIIKPVEQLSTNDFLKSIEYNLLAPFLLIQAFLPAMKQQRKGLLINIPGVLGKVPMAGAAAYSASKYGLVGMMQSIREEVKRTEIRFTNLYLGGVDSPFWDNIDLRVQKDKMIVAEEAAKAIWFLCQQPASGVVSEMVLQPFNHQAI
ncbi:MAG: SDR family NAD(P)-dependent oxidoreductase [Hydrotalea flava]|uniref:SDR family oxidoreductase n=1 Tax=Hydrotalea TaxID=1004300 RepID=UPI000943B6B5|nr:MULTISPECIES: SDR family oxidoreductase [Hydrotalea]MBY0348650.1 SDR family oxidoreductase [Hydrotalea flava]NIM36155.1 SDR family NAD(P)-dependent oxidoreductase [Hydrotalea flava]NIM39002.1 SDR family NAD(P)-dependent oxidoreductase [Hydrotalea flava]NIN04191.1 SDR family NAD(P)-dependent oxidoreductase [Hydrotalea flava]NIN15864.1 SDR family NAD(P)-dependent oxidoreductase [Hydrotalea flava]